MTVLAILVTATLSALAAPTATTKGATTTTASAPSEPQKPGHYRLFFKTRREKADLKLAYAVYLPKSYAPGRTYPMFVFLNGSGEGGDNHDGLYVHGPQAELKRNAELADWADFIVLAPQSPPGLRWDAPGLPKVVVDLVKYAESAWQVDADRVYVTGLSMGGAGTWNMALAGPGVFAAIAPISSVEVQPDNMVKALSGTTAWVICGDNDGECTAGSRKMAKVLSAGKIDTIFTEIPKGDHYIWGNFYSSKLFYQFLMLHRRGQAPPPSRPIKEQLLAIAYTPPNSMDAKLAEPFKKFQPWWYLLNCGNADQPGLRDELLGRKNIFVTTPLDAITPCRLLTTFNIPKDKLTRLEVTVARPPAGRWRLTIRGNGEDLLQQVIGSTGVPPVPGNPADSTRITGVPPVPTKPSNTSQPTPPSSQDPWQTFSADLTAWAGQEVRVELLNEALDHSPAAAYWGDIQLRSVDPPRTETACRGILSPTAPYYVVAPLFALFVVFLIIGLFLIRRALRKR